MENHLDLLRGQEIRVSDQDFQEPFLAEQLSQRIQMIEPDSPCLFHIIDEVRMRLQFSLLEVMIPCYMGVDQGRR